MTAHFGNFTDAERSVLLKGLDALSVAERKRNDGFAWGTPEKSLSNNTLEAIYHLKQTEQFSSENKSLLLAGLAELQKNEQKLNPSYEWGSPEKADSNKLLDAIRSLQKRIETSEAFIKRPSLDTLIHSAQDKSTQQPAVEHKRCGLFR